MITVVIMVGGSGLNINTIYSLLYQGFTPLAMEYHPYRGLRIKDKSLYRGFRLWTDLGDITDYINRMSSGGAQSLPRVPQERHFR